jgi:hypothetical protein
MVLQSDLLEAPGEIAADCVRHCILSWSMSLNTPARHSTAWYRQME